MRGEVDYHSPNLSESATSFFCSWSGELLGDSGLGDVGFGDVDFGVPGMSPRDQRRRKRQSRAMAATDTNATLESITLKKKKMAN